MACYELCLFNKCNVQRCNRTILGKLKDVEADFIVGVTVLEGLLFSTFGLSSCGFKQITKRGRGSRRRHDIFMRLATFCFRFGDFVIMYNCCHVHGFTF